ncbi:MAG: hypothetical protein K6E29_04085 [Cyanobacteria bacterium RUI128]|nr:hypothetical protein [Cyanobacteria bacterium RUI128]
MINKVMGSIVPKTAKAAIAGGKDVALKKMMRSETLGKVLDVAAENQTLCQSLFALAICVGPRPVTNYIITEDKKDATYANCHSISSGVVGYLWPMVFATPIAMGVKKMVANPTKYFKPEMIQKFYPSVKVEETLAQDGKSMIKKIATNAEGKMLRKDGTVLCADLEPLMVYGKRDIAAFEKKFPNFYVESKTNVVRIKPVQKEDGGWMHLKTENGVGKFKVKGDRVQPIGEAVQAKDFAFDNNGVLRRSKVGKDGVRTYGEEVTEKDLTPITEDMEIGAQKEQNVQKFVNMVPDILLAPFRASLTIALIPPLLKSFGIEKRKKPDASSTQTAQIKPLNVVSQSNNTVVKSSGSSTFSAFKKGVS